MPNLIDTLNACDTELGLFEDQAEQFIHAINMLPTAERQAEVRRMWQVFSRYLRVMKTIGKNKAFVFDTLEHCHLGKWAEFFGVSIEAIIEQFPD